jgi:hypothetical protein
MNKLHPLLQTAFGAFVFYAALGFSLPVMAQQSCETDSDCYKGFICEVFSGGACPDIACAEGEKCPETNCDSAEYRECVSGPCTNDSDCADGMVCYSNTYKECSQSAPACEPGQECPEPEPAQCETKTETQCIPRYEAPCTKDADCGAGFKCVESQMCSCSGSSGSAGGADIGETSRDAGVGGGSQPSSNTPSSSADGGAADPEQTENCGCKPSGDFSCEIQKTTCDSDKDCLSSWTCVEQNSVVSDMPCAVVRSEDGGVSEPVCPDAGQTQPAVKQCMPPYYDLHGVRSADNAYTLGAGQGEMSGAAGSTGQPKSDVTNDDESGDAGTGTLGNKKSSKSDDGGCHVVFGRTGSTSSWAFMAGLLALIGVRRRRMG